MILGTQSDAQSFRETGCNIVDKRVPGISLSTAQQQDEQRQHKVAKLTEKFESHQHKEQFLKDVSQTQKINRFSDASQKLLQDMDQTEIFELCENSTELQSSDCNSLTKIGIILLQLWTKFEEVAGSHNISKGQLRFQFDPWLHRYEEFQSRTKAWPI